MKAYWIEATLLQPRNAPTRPGGAAVISAAQEALRAHRQRAADLLGDVHRCRLPLEDAAPPIIHLPSLPIPLPVGLPEKAARPRLVSQRMAVLA